MNYEKKYKEALDWMRSLYDSLEGSTKEDAEHFFPELKEDDDERIRKEMIIWLKGFIGEASGVGYTEDEIKERIAWLAKQGEQKVTNAIEPKFKVGDWITCAELNTALILNIENDKYFVEYVSGSKGFPDIDYVDKHLHLWTIADAKDGDVLLFEGYYNSIVLFQGIGINGKGRINYHCKCDLGNYSFGVQGDVACLGNIEKDAKHYHPATKEQRDLLFQKMKEAGYEWDAEKKELIKIDSQQPEVKDITKNITVELLEKNGFEFSPEASEIFDDCYTITSIDNVDIDLIHYENPDTDWLLIIMFNDCEEKLVKVISTVDELQQCIDIMGIELKIV